MDLTMYWFMFPVTICVATSAMLSGISSAAMYVPIYIIIFPLLGKQYELASAIAAIGTGLLTETFGFSSGFIGYNYRKLIDFHVAKTFIKLSVPTAIAGALIAQFINSTLLKFLYACLVITMAWILVRVPAGNAMLEDGIPNGCHKPDKGRKLREIISRDGKVYHYTFAGNADRNAGSTAIGGFLTGMLAVGIGEVVMPQLLKRIQIPVPVAAGTSVLVVITTVISASFMHVSALITEGGLRAVPWHLVMYTIPGAIIGGQIAPRLQGLVSSHIMEKAIATVFIIIGLAMFIVVYQEMI